MKTFLCSMVILLTAASLVAAREAVKPRITLTLTDGKSSDYKLDSFDEKKVVVVRRDTLASVKFKRKEVSSISFGEDKSARFQVGEEGLVLDDDTLLRGHPKGMDIDTYWIVPEGSHKKEKIGKERVAFIQFKKPAGVATRGMSTGLRLFTADGWKDTGVDVGQGQKFWFTVSSEETFPCGRGPDATQVNADGKDPFVPDPRRPLPDVKQCALIAKIGKEGPPFRVGLSVTAFTADQEGRLYIEVNDYDFEDNQGKLNVYIKTGDL
jgi:hypothetical protein